MKKYVHHAGSDLPASIVVLLVALPLCLGIALGSGAPLFSGIIAGIVGGIVIGIISGSQLSVSGPAAGLTVIVAAGIIQLKVFDAFLMAVVLAGVFQLILGYIKAGVIGDYIPNSVIKGMLAAIGLILILKQLPHLVGYDADFMGDEGFDQSDHNNTISEMFQAFNAFSSTAIIIGIVALLILIVWELPLIKKNKIVQLIPGPLVVVLAGLLINEYFIHYNASAALSNKHLVNLPVANSIPSFLSFFTFPKFEYLTNSNVWFTAVTLSLVASLETLLGIEAVDKLDPFKRVTPANLELKAQGIGNIVSGLIGGLPLTSVVVRSSANVSAGAKTKVSAIMHGVLMLLCVMLIPTLLNKIPLSALAAILIFTGYKLVKLKLIKEFYHKGWDQFVPFAVTVLAILLTDLLVGIIIGILVGLFFMVRSNFINAVILINDHDNYLIRFRKDVSFLNKPIVKKSLEEVPENTFLLIDVTRADFIDKDIIEEINNFLCHAHLKNITTEIKTSPFNKTHQLFTNPQNAL